MSFSPAFGGILKISSAHPRRSREILEETAALSMLSYRGGDNIAEYTKNGDEVQQAGLSTSVKTVCRDVVLNDRCHHISDRLSHLDPPTNLTTGNIDVRHRDEPRRSRKFTGRLRQRESGTAKDDQLTLR